MMMSQDEIDTRRTSWAKRPDPVASPRAYDLWEAEHEKIGAGIPVGDGGQVMGVDGQLHATNAGYDGEGVYGWSCICGDGGSDHGSKDAATIASIEHLNEAGALVEVV